MRDSWPHAPPHYFTPHGTYIVTAATLHRKSLFDCDAKLDLFRDTTFELAKDYSLVLQAWAFFPNHYHLVVSFENTNTTHRDFVRHLHRQLATRLNQVDAIPPGEREVLSECDASSHRFQLNDAVPKATRGRVRTPKVRQPAGRNDHRVLSRLTNCLDSFCLLMRKTEDFL